MTTIGSDASWVIGHLADAAVRALLPAVVAALALCAFRVRHASLRLAIWTGVLYAALALPLLGLLLPAIPVPVPAKTAARAAAWLSEARSKLAAVAASPLPSSSTPSSSLSAANSAAFASAASGLSPVLFPRAVAPASFHRGAVLASGRTPVPALTKRTVQAGPAFRTALWRERMASLTAVEITLGIYALVLGFLLSRVGVGMVLSHRLRRTADAVDDQGALRWLRWHALAMGVDRAPAVMESAAVTVPLTLGVWRPVILLPVNWREWESTKLSAVIAHELSHVRRKDSRTKALALVYRSFFWFNPLSWWLEGHLAALSEQASDLAAIGAGAEPTYYAEVLMSFFGAMQANGARVNWQGISMARPGARGSRAQDRIEKVLSSKGILPVPRKARLLVLLALAAVPMVCLTAATRPVLVASAAPAPHLAAQLPAPPAPPPPAVAPVAVPSDRLTPPPTPDQPDAPRAVIAPAPPPSPPPPGIPVLVHVPPVAPAWTWMWAFPKAAVAGRAHVAPVAPPALPDPYAMAAPPMPAPPARFGQPPEPPEPAIAGDRDDDDWTMNNVHEGMTFAIVSGKSVTMNGSWDDRDEVKDLQKKIGGDFIWFIHSGNSYIIRDAATVKNAQRMYAPMEELGRKQEELGRQQEALGQKQEEVGKQQESARVQVPSDLEARLKKVEAEIHELGSTASQDDLGRLQGELGDLQGYLGDLQGKVGDEQGEFGRKQGELGEQQGELGRKQGELGRQQGELAREAARKMQAVLRQALTNGQAQRAPE